MSSLKFSVQHKEHRERAQPANRKKWGLLEKHKDYVLRAKDYHSKEQRLKILREKAQTRNPDEFYFGMYSSKTSSASASRGMREKERESSIALTTEQMKLLRTQDAGYLNTLLMQEQSAIDKLTAKLAFTRGAWKGKQSETQKEEEAGSDYDYSDEDEDEDPSLKAQKTRMDKRKSGSSSSKQYTVFTESLDDPEANRNFSPIYKKELTKEQQELLSKLEQHKERKAQISEVLKEAQLQKELLGKGPRRKVVKPDGKAVWKWTTQRKR
ncbi:small-subunit processome [Myxozyma melibiosi]|uniref:U3 small nucleolar RNA-associated protein 11 n=1 Tax=Myxozyma melibiosi TaxID=54550 RepID=A0ABR1F9K5_9ASCO